MEKQTYSPETAGEQSGQEMLNYILEDDNLEKWQKITDTDQFLKNTTLFDAAKEYSEEDAQKANEFLRNLNSSLKHLQDSLRLERTIREATGSEIDRNKKKKDIIAQEFQKLGIVFERQGGWQKMFKKAEREQARNERRVSKLLQKQKKELDLSERFDQKRQRRREKAATKITGRAERKIIRQKNKEQREEEKRIPRFLLDLKRFCSGGTEQTPNRLEIPTEYANRLRQVHAGLESEAIDPVGAIYTAEDGQQLVAGVDVIEHALTIPKGTSNVEVARRKRKRRAMSSAGELEYIKETAYSTAKGEAASRGRTNTKVEAIMLGLPQKDLANHEMIKTILQGDHNVTFITTSTSRQERMYLALVKQNKQEQELDPPREETESEQMRRRQKLHRTGLKLKLEETEPTAKIVAELEWLQQCGYTVYATLDRSRGKELAFDKLEDSEALFAFFSQ